MKDPQADQPTKPEDINHIILTHMLLSFVYAHIHMCVSFLECKLYLMVHVILQTGPVLKHVSEVAASNFSLSFHCSVHSVLPTPTHCCVVKRLIPQRQVPVN